MGYRIRGEPTPLLVKEDLTAKSESCFPYSPLAKIEEWWEDDWVSLTDGLVLPRLLQVALISAVGSHLVRKCHQNKRTGADWDVTSRCRESLLHSVGRGRQAAFPLVCSLQPLQNLSKIPLTGSINGSDQQTQQQRNQKKLGAWMMAGKWGDTAEESEQSGNKDRAVAKI